MSGSAWSERCPGETEPAGSNPVTPIGLFYGFEAVGSRSSGGSIGFLGVE